MKMFKNNMKFTRAACWINSKIRNRDKNTALIIFLFCHYCWSLLWSIYWSRLKLTAQIQLALHPCDPLLIKNSNMTGKSVEKCFVVLNAKLLVKLRFKTFYDFKILLYTAFALKTTTNTACFARTFCIF